MLKKILKKYYLIIPLLLTAAAALLALKSGKIVIGGDVPLYELNPWKYIKSSFYLWNPLDGVGRVADHFSSGLFFYAAYAILAKFMNFVMIQKIVFFILTLLPIFSINYLVGKIYDHDENHNVISLIASTFYIFNLYQLQTWSFALIMYQVAYITSPILIGLLISKKDTYKNLLLFAILTLINSLCAFNIAIFIGQSAIFGFLAVWFSIFSSNTKKTILFYAKYVLVYIIVNSIWFIQFISRYLGNVAQATGNDWNQVITAGNIADTTKYNIISHAVRLMSSSLYGFWLGKYDFPSYRHYESLPFTIVNFLFFAIIVLGAIFYYKKSEYKKNIAFFLALAIIGIFLFKGAASPFHRTYMYLFDKYPILSMFRTPQNKFGLMIVIPYSVLFGWSIKEFFVSIKNHYLKIFFIVGIVAMICMNLYPYWQGKMFFPRYQNNIPESYFSVSERANQVKSQGRVLILPFYESTWLSTKWDYIGYDPLYYMLNKPYFSRGFDWMSDPNAVANKQIMTALEEKSSEKFTESLKRYQIDTIIIHRDYNLDTFGVPDMVANFDQILKENNNISLAEKTNELELYSVNNIKINEAYFANNPAVIHGKWEESNTTNYDSMFDAFFVTDQNKDNLSLLNKNVTNHIYNFSAPEINIVGKEINFSPEIFGKKEIYAESSTPNYSINLNGKDYSVKNSKNISKLGEITLDGNLTLKVNYDPLIPINKINLDDWQINDSSLKTSNESQFSKTINSENNKFFNLISNNGQAGIRKKIVNLDKNSYYMFSFDYKNVTGESPRFIIEGIELKSGAIELNKILYDETLPKSNEIKHKDIILKTDPFEKIFIYFYSNKPGKNSVRTENIYGNIEINKIISPIDSILIKNSGESTINQETNSIKNINYDEYKIKTASLKNNQFLIFEQGYYPYWIANSENNNLPHLTANFYANAWFVPTNTTEIKIQYKTHNLLWISYSLVLILFIIIVIFFAKEKIKNDKNQA